MGGCDLVQCHLWVIWREARRWRNPTASGAMSTVQQRHDTVILRPGHHADLRADTAAPRVGRAPPWAREHRRRRRCRRPVKLRSFEWPASRGGASGQWAEGAVRVPRAVATTHGTAVGCEEGGYTCCAIPAARRHEWSRPSHGTPRGSTRCAAKLFTNRRDEADEAGADAARGSSSSRVEFGMSSLRLRLAAAQGPKYTIIRPYRRWRWGASPSPATSPDSPARSTRKVHHTALSPSTMAGHGAVWYKSLSWLI